MPRLRVVTHDSVKRLLEKLKREFLVAYKTIVNAIDQLSFGNIQLNCTRKLYGQLFELKKAHCRIVYTIENGVLFLLFGFWKSKSKTDKSVINAAFQIYKNAI